MGTQLNPEREENHRLVYLIWEKPKKLYQMIPKNSLSSNDTKHFSPFIQ